MPIISKPYYLAKCDKCGVEWDGDEFSAWSDRDGAERTAYEDDWTSEGDVWHCPDCPPLDVDTEAGDNHAQPA